MKPMSLPENVVLKLSDPKFKRVDPKRVSAVLTELAVTTSETFVEFYGRYEGPFGSARLGYELLDLCVGDPSVASSTKICRAEYGFSDDYLVLTDLLGGSVLVYGSDSDQVFDVDFEGGQGELAAGQLKPAWISFADFLQEYFG
jgi:hypothetical protein